MSLISRTVRDGTGRRRQIRIGVLGFLPPQTAEWDQDLTTQIGCEDILPAARRALPAGPVPTDEAGEQPADALARELHEELGLDPTEAYPWITRVHRYEHATVRLHFFRVKAWSGEPQPREGQSILWQQPGASLVEPMLPARPGKPP